MKTNISMNFFTSIKLYKDLAKSETLPQGTFEVQWTGPRWFQFVAKHGLGLLGFKYWFGKEFFGNEDATNLFKIPGSITKLRKYPMSVKIGVSRIDGNTSIQVSYPQSTRFPWPYVIDEFRSVNDDVLIGLSYLKWAPIFPMPFYLMRKE
ncbi:hypothetical protein EHQ58_03415 [Leptospira ognonensis]|uniref:Uncharacterized protein n=1 Tax=Leptospira ognonensis TaxID=2484945 RepID=A0A4R9K9A5_9LEPT|nr:hypothetical protein [Leptospira ognonensis]TGL62262.1 hypothetical protein EHQ58_03415 [Leptospira ognonensis]